MGMFFVSCNSASRGFFAFLVSPILAATLKTCVSTAITGFRKTTEATTFAVFLPTPGSLCSISGSEGTSPLNSVRSIFAIPDRCFALLLGYEHDLMNWNISDGSALAMLPASGNRFIRAGVIIFTLLSVHWADKITATISAKGSLYSSSVSATGIFTVKYLITLSYLSFKVIY